MTKYATLVTIGLCDFGVNLFLMITKRNLMQADERSRVEHVKLYMEVLNSVNKWACS